MLQSRLRSFADDLDSAGPCAQRIGHLETIEVSQVAGSVGRARELLADFRPAGSARRSADEMRLEAIRIKMERGDCLPPIDLYKLGASYYVLDGHHRVAAARLIGQVALEATVVEFVPLGRVRSPSAQNCLAGTAA